MTSGDRRPSGIVLAGGRSTRFGSDKLLALVGDRPLLHRPIEALASVCFEVLVVVGPDADPPLPTGLAVPVCLVRDDEPGAGPFAALITGLARATRSTVLVVGGDMPGLVPGLLADLARRPGPGGFDAAVLHDGETVRPLPMALLREPALATAGSVRATGGRRLRDLLAGLRVVAVPEAEWRALDPLGSTLVDVDRPEDLG